MRTTDIIIRAGRNLRQAKVRTLLTALAISVGAFTITLALAAGSGGQAYTDNLIKSNGDKNSLSVYPKNEKPGESGPEKYGQKDEASTPGVLTNKDVQKIESVSGVKSVLPNYLIEAEYMLGPNAQKYNTNVTIKADQTEPNLIAGSLQNNVPKSGTVMISDSYVKPLGFSSADDAIGKTITLHFAKKDGNPTPESKDINYTIAAVDKKADTSLGYTTGVKLNSEDGKSIYDYQVPASVSSQFYGLTVFVKEGANVRDVQTQIEKKDYQVFSSEDMQKMLFTFVNIVMAGVAGFGALAIIASIFGIINTQYISVLERTRQIGLMKALGARRKDIGRLFRYEAAWVGFLGGLIGTLLALLVGLLNPWIASQLNLEKGTNLLIFNPFYSIILIISLMLVAVLAGYFPSRKASKLDPIEALRTE